MGNIQKGLKIYEKFTEQFKMDLMTPRTTTLEMFAILHAKGLKELLLREMMIEFLTNIDSTEIKVINHKVYAVLESLEELK